ncbi:Multidrug resistance protein 3 [Maliponia aquimaris]|uniref:Multidrug resistance protein 3 n=2 Tax=Maliponia aquimaris TaxID=1673631 RepID=A0A238L6P4_9RHOB|nr:Multidrug resistance protein 3 [Maliponia aquimaris]
MSLADPSSAMSEARPDPAGLRLALGAIATTLLFASLGQTIVSTALPVMVADLGGMDHITWVVTAYLLASTIGAPLAGKLSDLYGRKAILQGGILVFLAGALVCGTAQSMEMLIAGRAVQGLGGGGLIVTCMTAVGDLLPPRERGRAQGLLGAAFGVSTVIGPLLGGAIVQSIGWHWIFFVNVPVGVAAYVVLNRALSAPTVRQTKPVDYLGAALLAVLLSSIVLLPNLGGAYGWASPQVMALGAVIVLSLAGFVLVERRAVEPILPLSLFRNNTFLVINAVGFLVGMGMFGTITFLPLFLQVVQGVTPTTSGLFLVPMMGGLILSSQLSGRMMSRSGRYKVIPIVSTGLLALALAALAQMEAATSLWAIGAVMVLVGLGLGPVFAVGVAAIQNAVPRAMMGVGTASTNMFRLIGGSLGTAVFGAMFAAGLARAVAGQVPGGLSGGIGGLSASSLRALPAETQTRVLDGFSTALHPVFWVAAAAALLACLVSMLLIEEPLADN